MKKTITILTIFLGFIIYTSCGKNEVKESESKWANKMPELYSYNDSKKIINEGLIGTLTLKEGNCQPIEKSTCKEYPVSRKIRIYEYTKSSQTKSITLTTYSEVSTKLVITIQSDSEGFYQTILPAGKYSIFIEENGVLYANGFDGQGGINPFEVENAKTSKKNLIIDYASY